jgi:hypothetical protein
VSLGDEQVLLYVFVDGFIFGIDRYFDGVLERSSLKFLHLSCHCSGEKHRLPFSGNRPENLLKDEKTLKIDT